MIWLRDVHTNIFFTKKLENNVKGLNKKSDIKKEEINSVKRIKKKREGKQKKARDDERDGREEKEEKKKSKREIRRQRVGGNRNKERKKRG